MSLSNISSMTLDAFVKSLADTDPVNGQVESNMKLFFKGSLNNRVIDKVAIQVTNGGNDRYVILDSNYNMIYSETITTASKNHPQLQEVFDTFISKIINGEKNDLYRDRLKGNQPFSVRLNAQSRKSIGNQGMDTSQWRRQGSR